MKKFFVCAVLLLIASLQLNAQRSDLYVKRTDKGLSVEHKVAPKESFFSIGRLFNVHPRHIASFNKLDFNKGLQIDQRLLIPLTDTNFTQKGNSGTPVYYKTAASGNLADVSKANGNVPVSRLKSWNNLSTDQVKKDAKLIIGFLQSKELPSVTLKVKQEEPVKIQEQPVTENRQPEKPKVEVGETPKVEPKPELKPVEEVKKPAEVPAPVISRPVEQEPMSNNNQGYFKPWFDQQVKMTPVSKEETVTAGIFKTASGWQDGKYYILMDGVSIGTIIRVSNPSNTRVIYAKVLGEMSGIRQNDGYNVRISNAAASMLQVTDTEKFILKITY